MYGFEPGFAFVFCSSFADPHHTAVLRHGAVFVKNQLDHLSAPKIQTSAHAETFLRGFHHQAGRAFLQAGQIDDHAGGTPGGEALRAAFGNRMIGHARVHIPSTHGLPFLPGKRL